MDKVQKLRGSVDNWSDCSNRLEGD